MPPPAAVALQALHPSAAALLSDKQPPASSSSTGGVSGVDEGPEVIPGSTESVFFGTIAKAAEEQRKAPAAAVPGVTKFLGFAGGFLGDGSVGSRVGGLWVGECSHLCGITAAVINLKRV